ncbi:LysR family transcriptional regulator [Thiobacillus sp.]|uniref:LysR family transcriptional regulator n=1 Tax=Thiobacillus sp. TaxID=924 RepID=UPI0011DB5312|nr:LysR family transcriptional regulator [Thiobacillus sp.]MBD3811873.1 LysR family transcriptional regulator [Betaproteobacteria bacterium]MBC2730087.1 LysR family transcriptional regulator [Thiobacillus sp.]MBC2738825.1 LysR family transcriptional regulator [Thiobacillus sp.]MBC2760884.1 LysR family transcriptional regulator [Thiobacillus sp.]TXH74589.1 MAG: LysR family transcriptional regulator [Thiobacillus sp.]
MNVTFRQLRLLEAVARHSSFTRASEELHLTQPAVSTQIKQLEEEVGMPLFEQMGKKIFLTEVGKEVYAFSRAIAQQFRDIESVLDDMKGVKRGTLALTVTSTGKYFAPYLLASFLKRYPGTQVHLEVANREELVQQLQDNTPDMVIMGTPPDNIELQSQAFMQNPLVIIAPPDHPLVGVNRVPLSRLVEENFILRERGSGTRNAVERFFQQRGIKFKASMEMSRNEAIKHAVMAGLGLGIVSLHTLEFELELGRVAILSVEGFPIMKEWYMVHRSGKRMSPIAQAFREFVLNEADRIMKLPQPKPVTRSRRRVTRS